MSSMPTGQAMPVVGTDSQPAQMPASAPMPTPVTTQQPMAAGQSPAPMQQPEPIMQAPIAAPIQAESPMQTATPQVERMEMPMQPIDLTGQSEMPIQQMAAPEEGGDKKKMIIIIVVIVAGLLAGLAGFFVWRSMSAPEEVAPVTEAPINIPSEPTPIEQVTVPVTPEQDDISVIEQELNAFNVNSVDAELQTGLNEVNAAL